jgi:hypothetical protein
MEPGLLETTLERAQVNPGQPALLLSLEQDELKQGSEIGAGRPRSETKPENEVNGVRGPTFSRQVHGRTFTSLLEGERPTLMFT